MPDELDVCGIGSALVDVLVEATLEQVAACGLVKGSMQLMDLAAADAVLRRRFTVAGRLGRYNFRRGRLPARSCIRIEAA